MGKIVFHDDHNKDWKKMPCGFKIEGRPQRMKMVANLHKKKCELCANFATKTLTDMTDLTPVSNKKIDYLKYEKGEYVSKVEYSLELS
jgi:hypothetical protein